MITLGIETSCDETSMCLLKNGKVISLCTHSQIDLHKVYGGVVPEIASRDHLAKIDEVYRKVLNDAQVDVKDINLIAYTAEPGLIGSLLTGIMFAKGLEVALGVPAVPVNHVYGHVFTCGLTHGVYEDFVCLLVSGGHTAIYDVKNVRDVRLVGQSIDDSFGEVFDKLSKALGFGYPGGANIEKIASYGDENAHIFNIPLKGKSDFDFSLSGIKTEFLKIVQKIGKAPVYEDVLEDLKNVPHGTCDEISLGIANICASFQKVVVRIILDRLSNVVRDVNYLGRNLVLCGGVASNSYIRKHIQEFCEKHGMQFCVPDKHLCTDNAAMIANVGEILHRG